MAVSYIVVIPARYKSSRFPGKPLIDLNGKTMIQRTYDQCLKCFPKEKVFVATEDSRIVDHCNKLGMNVILTSDNCLTGTDRIAEEEIEKEKGQIINGYCNITSEEDFFSTSIPKVVIRPDGRLLYMSRSPIPGNKSKDFNMGCRQVCAYAFPKEELIHFSSIQTKTPLENEEDIEILRFLEMGYDVKMIQMSDESIAIDNPEDVYKVLAKL
jgi:3-deoxy-manno-octulosonate cytidylyltransferase (CMP-KDO synthetase)